MSDTRSKPHPVLAGVVAVCALAALLVADGLMVRLNGNMVNADFFSFRLGGCGVLEGVSVYDPATWADLHVRHGRPWMESPIYTYPWPTPLMFAPLCMLPLPQAAVVWEMASQVMLIISIAALFAGLGASRPPLALMAPIVFLSRPTIAVFTNGQLAALWPFSLSLFYFLARRERYAAAGGVLTLLLLKPSLPVAIVPVALAWLLKRRAWKGLMAFVLVSGAGFALSLLAQPGWVEQWRLYSSIRGGEFGAFVPTLWGLLHSLLADYVPQPIWLGAGGIAAGLLIAFCIWWSVRTADPWAPALVLSFAACISLLVSPYVWNYDQVLLILPLGLVLAVSGRMGPKQRMLTWAGAVAVMGVLPYVLLAVAIRRGIDTWSVLVPLAMIVLLTAATYWGLHAPARTPPIGSAKLDLTGAGQ